MNLSNILELRQGIARNEELVSALQSETMDFEDRLEVLESQLLPFQQGCVLCKFCVPGKICRLPKAICEFVPDHFGSPRNPPYDYAWEEAYLDDH